tara:strand:- start:401 stop:1078 length:678 start_codon:yes stop_codon:yes gene_type:complete
MKKNNLMFTLILALFITACSQSHSETNSTQESQETLVVEAQKAGYAIGDEAADFSLPNIDDKMVSLSDYADAKGYIVTFTCNHCPYAVAYESRIMDLDKKYTPLGYPVIAISPNDPAIVPEDGMEEMKKLATTKGYTFPYLLDDKQEIYPQYGATKTPHIFVLNKEEGKNIVKYIGAIDNNYADKDDVTERYVEDAVDALLAGTAITTTTTKAIGCSIKDKRNKK